MGLLIITGLASIATKAGPVLQPLTSPDTQIIDMIQQVNESLLYYYNTHLTAFGPHVTGTENSMNVSQYIYDEFHAMGLFVEFHYWSFDDLTDRNVVATLPGTDTSSNAIFIFCAHHDSVKLSPGADDDGSGVAAVLATAKILSQYAFNYTLRFITFSGEEDGLYGSYLYAHNASRRGDNIVAVIDADMIGYAVTTEGGRLMTLAFPERAKWIADFVTIVSTLYRNKTNMTVLTYPHSSGSDFQSFDEYEFDAGSFQGYDCGYDSYYWDHIFHSANDTSDRLNWTYLTNVTKLLLAVIAEFASTPIELQVIISSPYQGYYYFFNVPLYPIHYWKNSFYSPRGIPIIFGSTTVIVDVIPRHDNVDVIFCLDGNIVEFFYDNASSHSWTIHHPYFYPLIGKHVVQVYVNVYTTSEQVASDEINIITYTI